MSNGNWIWITGATGFSGSFLAEELKKRNPGSSILGIGRREVAGLPVDVLESVDLTDPKAIDRCVEAYPPSHVYHLAAAMPPASDGDMWHFNVAMIHELLSGLARGGKQQVKVLSVGSAAELQHKPAGAYTEDDPSLGFTPYGKSKAAQARIAVQLGKELGIDVYVARAFNFLGPGLPDKWVAGRLCQQLATSRDKIVLGNLQAERDFVDIRDVASAYCDIVEKGQPGIVYNVCTGVSTPIESLVQQACALLGDECPEIQSDAEQLQRSEVSVVYGDPTRLQAATGWQPQFDLDQSLRDMIESYRD